MAILDLGLLSYFGVIFPALLIFAIVYALLEKLKILGENKSINAVVAIAVAFIVILSKDVASIINYIAPWFVLLFIFVVLLLMVYKIFGATDENLKNFITSHALTQWVIVIIGVIIIASGIANVYGDKLKPITGADGNNTVSTSTTGESADFGENVGRTLFHPKIVGLVLIFLIAAFAIGLLTHEVA